MIFGKKGSELEPLLIDGRPLLPNEIALYVAMDGEPSDSLKRILTVLSVHHGLNIGVIRVRGKGLSILAGSDASQRLR